MFTGLIQQVGTVSAVRRTSTGLQVVVDAPDTAAEAAVGDSIACSGVCLTVEELTAGGFEVHAGAETVERTTAGNWSRGTLLNIEPALRASDRLGGHIVQGHVDCVGRCEGVRTVGETTEYTFSIPAEFGPYIVQKGSIAVDGISLTITDITDDRFSVAIIPHTMSNTTLEQLTPNTPVNIEVDILAKYVHRMLGLKDEGAGGITEAFLRDHGFMS
jgi:riboflavin synthase